MSEEKQEDQTQETVEKKDSGRKKTIPLVLGSAVLLLVAAAVAGYFVLNSRSAGKETGTSDELSLGVVEEVAEKEEMEGESFSGKLADALKLGKSMKCEWQVDENNYGSAYVKNEKVYSEITSEGRQMKSIVLGDCAYTWEEGVQQGYKMCGEAVEADELEETEVEEENEEPVEDWEMPDVNYNCEPSVVDDSLFELPEDVNFVSPAEAAQQAVEGMFPEGTELPDELEDLIPQD